MRLLGFFGAFFYVVFSFADVDLGSNYKYDPESGLVFDSENKVVSEQALPTQLIQADIQLTERISDLGNRYLLLNVKNQYYLYQKKSYGEWSLLTSTPNKFAQDNNITAPDISLDYSEVFGAFVMSSTSSENSVESGPTYFILNRGLDPTEMLHLSQAVTQWMSFPPVLPLNEYLNRKLPHTTLKIIAGDVSKVLGQPLLSTSEKTLEGSHTQPEIPRIPVMNEKGETVNAWDMISTFTSDYINDVAGDTYEEIEELRKIEDKILKNFLKMEGGSVKLLAPAGVGKSVLMRRVAYRLRVGDVPNSLKNLRVRYFSATSLEAGTKYVGTIESRINAMVEVSKKVPVIWFVDEAHAIAGAGISDGRPTNALQSLKPALAAGTVKFLAASTPSEWSAAFSNDEPMDRRFVRVDLDVPDKVLLMKILNKWAVKHKKSPLSEALLEKVIFYSNEFGVEGAQPSKATKLLNEIYANADFADQTTPITLQNIQEAVYELYNVNPAEFDPAQVEKRYDHLEQTLQDIVGQKEAKEAILAQTFQIMKGMHDRSKPRYRFLFSGDKGLGKTEMIKLFARAMDVPEGRIVMSEFASPHQVEALKARIAQLVRIHPMTVFSFDEFEKAHPQVQQALLGILESDSFTYTINEGGTIRSATVQVKNTSMFVLTNAGAGYLASRLHAPAKPQIGFGREPVEKKFSAQEFRQAIMSDGIDPYVLDRMEKVIPFKYFTPNEFALIVHIHTKKILKSISENSDIKFEITNLKNLVMDFTNQMYTPQASARDVLRNLNEFVRQALASATMNHSAGDTIKLAWNGEVRQLQEATPAGAGLSCRDLF